MKATEVTIVILSGGRATRIRQKDKGLLPLNGKPLIMHVVANLNPVQSPVLINANRNHDQYRSITGLAVIKDEYHDFKGPLAGIAAAMKAAATPYVLVIPCDSPYVNIRILRLLKPAFTDNPQLEIAVAHDGKRMQPAFALLKTDLYSNLKQYLNSGNHKTDLWYKQRRMTMVDCSAYPYLFINLNHANDFAHQTKPTVMNNVPVIGFAAFSGTGKTTLITRLITCLRQHRIRTAFVKNAHHNFIIDHPGKDSYKAYQAGANQVLISSKTRFALIQRHTPQIPEPKLGELLRHLDCRQLDLIIIEGFKQEPIQKIELQRYEMGLPDLYEQDDKIIAIARDKIRCDHNHIILDINQVEQIAEFILAYMQQPDQNNNI